MTPIGARSVKADFPAPAGDASTGTTSPASVRASGRGELERAHSPIDLDTSSAQRLGRLRRDDAGESLTVARRPAAVLVEDSARSHVASG